MGDVLAGNNAVWEFEPDAVVIRYSRGVRGTRLLQALGERRVPHAALTGVTLAEGRRGTAVLRALPRPGADPVIEAAAGQLKEAADPYRLVLPEQSRTLGEYYRDELAAALAERARQDGAAHEPAARFLVEPPPVPRSFKAYDAKAYFDGRTVSFRWFWTGASTAKWRAGDQTFPVEELRGLDWRSPELMHGHLRLLVREDPAHAAAAPRGAAAGPAGLGGPAGPGEAAGASGEDGTAPVGPGSAADQDPAAVVFGMGYGPVHESLPFAAAVLAAIRAARPRL